MTKPRWTVSASGRQLSRDGEPHFLLADTAWELMRRLTTTEAETYLTRRARQGFNAVLACAIGCNIVDGLRVPTIDGRVPFHDLEPRRPAEDYWRHVDDVVGIANGLGLTVGLLPAWGTHWHERNGPPFFTPANTRDYATWIAQRYRSADVIWVLGGDRPVTAAPHRAVITEFAAGIRAAVGNDHLITLHPSGFRSSADFFPDAPWLDIHLVQSGHTGFQPPNYQLVEDAYEQQPAKPVLDGEPNYEDHPVMDPTWNPVPSHYFGESAVRRAAYHAVFAGACGHVYGCHDVWQMYDPVRYEPVNGAREHWLAALELPGAAQMAVLAALMSDVGLAGWQPAQQLIAPPRGALGRHQRVLSRRDEESVLVYAPGGRDVRLDLRPLMGTAPGAAQWTMRWWDVRRGGWSDPVEREGGPVLEIAHPHSGTDSVLQVLQVSAARPLPS